MPIYSDKQGNNIAECDYFADNLDFVPVRWLVKDGKALEKPQTAEISKAEFRQLNRMVIKHDK